MVKVKRILTGFTEILQKPEMQILPGQIAFYFIMSIIPIAAISAIIASYITKSFDFLDTIGSVMPSVLANILVSLTNDMQFQGVAFVLILYLLLGSNAPASIITASNMLYNVKQPSYLRLKIKSFVMTIIIKVLYTLAPSAKIKSSTTTKGALFTTVGWIVATYIFAFYITNVASYDVIYGNFANILILLLWVYILAYLFVVGMAFNVDKFHRQGKCVCDGEKKEKDESSREDKNEEG